MKMKRDDHSGQMAQLESLSLIELVVGSRIIAFPSSVGSIYVYDGHSN